MKPWLKTLLILVPIVLVVILVYPWETVVVPKWRARIVDESGNIVKGAKISETWQDYSVESYEHWADGVTDNDGYVAFPRRTVRASLVRRVIWPIKNVLETGIHASFGRDAFLRIAEPGYCSTTKGDWWVPGRPLPEEVIVERTKR